MKKYLIFGMSFVAVLLLTAQTTSLKWSDIRASERHGNALNGQSSDNTGATNAIPKFDANGNVTGTGATIDASNNVSTPGSVSTGVGSGLTGAVDLIGATSGNTVTITVGTSTAAGTLTAPGATGTLDYVSSAGTSGHCVKFASDGIGLLDNGSACGSGGSGALTQIGQVITAGSATSVSFTSISGAYSNLVLTYTAATTSAVVTVGMNLEMNSDTTAGDYSTAQYTLSVGGSLTAGTAAPGSSGMFIMNIPGTSATANNPGSGRITINGYAGTTFFKRCNNYASYSAATNQENKIDVSGTWLSTTAITRLDLTINSDAFQNGSVFTLYGEQ